ncbi:MAG: TldD/PmbA family protein [candidate division Zixibacteria bacterium]|nr:TldD/PmbA family protein [candidate division Zixibacteria bacterium]
MIEKNRYKLDRRSFLKGGVALFTAPLWLNYAFGFTEETRDILEKSLSDEDFKKILQVALSRGGEFAEIYLQHLIRTEIQLDEDKIKSFTYGIIQGAGIRVISKEKTGYAFSDDLSFPNLKEAAEASAHIASSDKIHKPIDLSLRRVKPYFTLKSPVALASEQKRIGLLQRANQSARDYDKRIQNVRVDYYDEAKKILIINSQGLKIKDEQFIVRLGIYPLAVEGSNRFEGYASLGGRIDLDYFDKNTPEYGAREAAKQAIIMLKAEDAPAGLNPVVAGPGWGGVLIHEAFGHSLEGDGIRKKTSLMADKIGEKVASEIVNVVDDATIPYGRGSFNVDDEGTPGQKKLLVKDGILQGYLYDLLNAKLMNTQSTGNGRRTSYREFPIPRMTNTFIEPGASDPEDIIKSVKKGVYAKKMGGGTVDSASGNFNFLVREAYLIEDGKITQPLKNAVLIGNGLEAIKKIEMVGTDLLIDQTTGTCGKDGQWVYAGVGQPTIKFSEITIGGTAYKPTMS